MTFKHIRLQDSEIFRSFEFVAHKKGWLPSEAPAALTKQASEQTSLAATNNLDETILRLASALRASDFAKYADNLESKFINYKTAKVNLYQAHKETGDDLLNEAHPEGDVKMADAENEGGVIETLQSRHKKIVDMINKAPTGKLASVNDVINQVKIALGPGAQVGGAREVELPRNFFERPVELAEAGRMQAVKPASLFEGLLPRLLASPLALPGAIVGGALLGEMVGRAYFLKKFYAPEFNDAVDNLLSEIRDVEDYKDGYNNMSEYVDNVRSEINTYNGLASKISWFKEHPSIDSLKSLDQLHDSAAAVSVAADKIREEAKKVLGAENSSSFDMIVWKTRSAQFRDVELAAANVSKVVTTKIIPGIMEVLNVVRKAVDNAEPSEGGASKLAQLTKDLSDTKE